MTKPVRISALAERHILEIDAWWRERREKAPDLFEQELAAGLQTIASAPGAGQRYPHASADVRRLLLRSTRNHLYYVELPAQVLVVAVWGGIKGAGPDLSTVSDDEPLPE